LGEDGKGKIKGIRDGRMGKGGKKKKKNQFDMMEEEGMGKNERRKKAGRVWDGGDPITEDDF
jgi:hypothetical protein